MFNQTNLLSHRCVMISDVRFVSFIQSVFFVIIPALASSTTFTAVWFWKQTRQQEGNKISCFLAYIPNSSRVNTKHQRSNKFKVDMKQIFYTNIFSCFSKSYVFICFCRQSLRFSKSAADDTVMQCKSKFSLSSHHLIMSLCL